MCFWNISNSLKSRVKFSALRPTVFILFLTNCMNGIISFIYFFNSAVPANMAQNSSLSGNLFPVVCNVDKNINAQEKVIVAYWIVVMTYEIYFLHHRKDDNLPMRISLNYPDDPFSMYTNIVIIILPLILYRSFIFFSKNFECMDNIY